MVALVHERLQPSDPRVVLEDVPHHEDAPPLLRQGDEPRAFARGERQRLLHEDVLAGLEGAPRDREVRLGRRGNHDGVHAGAQHGVQIRHELRVRSELGGRPLAGRAWLADLRQGAKLAEIAHEVPAPVAAADDGHSRGPAQH